MIKSTLVRIGAAAIVAAAGFAFPAQAENEKGYYSYGSEAVVFKDPNFRGAGLRIDGPITNMKYERFNDTISSIELRGTWQICVDPDFRGKCEIVTGSQSRLTHIRMNDNITSMRPVSAQSRYGNYGYGSTGNYGYNNQGNSDRYSRNVNYNQHSNYAGIVLYRDPNFRGSSIGLEESVSNLKHIGFNDTISSIAVNDGLWLVCEDPDFRGRCEVINGSVQSAHELGLNDKITSIRPYYDRGYRNY